MFIEIPMNHSDFKIGLEFMSVGGFPYRCTDVGRRTIAAIALTEGGQAWFEGPPYAVNEKVFDELDIANCALNAEGAIRAAIAESETGLHPSYPNEAIKTFMEARSSPDYIAYPNKPLLRLTKVLGGDIYKAYGVRKDGGFWILQCFCLFDDEFIEIPERLFLESPIATDDDYRARRACL